MVKKLDGAKTMALPEGSKGNYRLAADAGKATFFFPDKAELTRGKCEFKSPDEFLQYLRKSLGSASAQQSLRGTVSRRGKYQKVDKSGNPVLTIGDPILDLVSDDEARIFIEGKAIHLTETEFASARYRSGGLRSIDLAPHSGALSQSQLLAAARGEGDFVVVEASDRALSFASTNPSQQDFFPSGGGHLRFKAWKKSYTVYWSMGARSRPGVGNSPRRGSRAGTSIPFSPRPASS
jgi:hypothetical protein